MLIRSRLAVPSALLVASLAVLAGCSADPSNDPTEATSEGELAQTSYLLGTWAVADDPTEGGLVATYERRGARATDLAMFTQADQATIETSGTYLLRHAVLGSRHGRFVVYGTSAVGLEGGETGRVKFIPVSSPGETVHRANDCHFAISPIMGEGVYLNFSDCTDPTFEMELKGTVEQTSATAITSFGYCYAPTDCYEQSAVLPPKGGFYYQEMTPAVQSLLDDWRTSYNAWNHVGQTAAYSPNMTFACASDHTCSVHR